MKVRTSLILLQAPRLEDELESGHYFLDSLFRKLANFVFQIAFVYGHHLRDIYNAGFWEVCLSLTQQDVSRGGGELLVRSKGAQDNGTYLALVERIVLDHYVGMPVAWLGTLWLFQIDPENIALAYHHWSTIPFIFFLLPLVSALVSASS